MENRQPEVRWLSREGFIPGMGMFDMGAPWAWSWAWLLPHHQAKAHCAQASSTQREETRPCHKFVSHLNRVMPKSDPSLRHWLSAAWALHPRQQPAVKMASLRMSKRTFAARSAARPAAGSRRRAVGEITGITQSAHAHHPDLQLSPWPEERSASHACSSSATGRPPALLTDNTTTAWCAHQRCVQRCQSHGAPGE